MTLHRLLASTLMCVLLLPLPVAAWAVSELAEPAKLTGTWQLDLASSRIWKKATRPLWRVDDIRLEGGDMYWSWHAEEPKGPWKASVHLATDGREMRNVVAGHASRSRGSWRGDTLQFLTRGRAFLLPYRLEDRIWLTDGGRVMNVARRFRMATLNEDEHWVFKRVERGSIVTPEPESSDPGAVLTGTR